MTFTVTDFFRQFPTDDACLEHLWNVRFGDEVECEKCGKVGKFYRLRKEPAYSCLALRPPYSPDGRNAVRKEPHAAAKAVLRHVPVHHDAARGFGEGAATLSWA